MIAAIGVSSSHTTRSVGALVVLKSVFEFTCSWSDATPHRDLGFGEVDVIRTGAHVASLHDEVQEEVAALRDSGAFAERLLEKESKHIRQTDDFEVGEAHAVGAWAHIHPDHVTEVHVTFGQDKGGDANSVTIVAFVLNKLQLNKLSNTNLVAVFPPCRKSASRCHQGRRASSSRYGSSPGMVWSLVVDSDTCDS